MIDRAAIVTGPERGIGRAIANQLRDDGWFVIGIGLGDQAECCHAYCRFDLTYCLDAERFRTECLDPVRQALKERPLGALVNNAAVQLLAPLRELEMADWQATLAVNLSAPLCLAQAFVDELRDASGAIINIGSVHAHATKPEFISYATSKAALHGLTRALAVDLGGEVRVCGVAPAAIETEMLTAGFDGRAQELALLKRIHPARRIGRPEEVAKAVAFLVREDMPFLTGSIFALDGGILARLHDPA